MIKNIFILFSFSGLLFAGTSVSVSDAYVRAVPPNLKNSASFMKIKNNTDNKIVLVQAQSDIAQNVELHEHTMGDKGMMVMRQIPSIEIAPNSEVDLKPGGLHVMLIGLKQKLVAGQSVKQIKLVFSDDSEIVLKDVPIKKVMGGMKHHKGHMHHQ